MAQQAWIEVQTTSKHNMPPRHPRPSNVDVQRLTGRFGNLSVEESREVEQRERMLRIKPWRILRYVWWRAPPLRLLLVSDNLPDSKVGGRM